MFLRLNREQGLFHSPFWIMVQKEVTDHLRSWRFIILLALLAFTCLGSLYTALMSIRDAVSSSNESGSFLFLKLFTVSDGTLPPYITFVSFIGPLLGIALGFDAINGERNRGTLSRLMSQPIPRDSVIIAKLVSSVLVISFLFFSLGFLVMGLGILMIGIPPTFEEFLRIILYTLISIVYVAFWVNLSLLFSIRFRQAATSALSSIAIWLFFSVFYSMLVNIMARAMIPKDGFTETADAFSHQVLMQNIQRLAPNQLFSEATTTLLVPSVRSLGPLTMEQVYGTIPSALPLGQSVLLIWPHLTGMIAGTLVCFAVSYLMFMRQEIRSR